MNTTLNINGKTISLSDIEADTPLLWVLRDELKLKGAKFGCGMGLCGACTVHIDGVATRSCVFPVSAVQGKKITTIEGITQGDKLHPVQQAWLDNEVSQCGYCQPGFIMSAVALLDNMPSANESDIQTHITNICRCGTYPRAVKAIKEASRKLNASSKQ